MAMENEMTLKQKVIAVLRESIKCGREEQFIYGSIYEPHRLILQIEKFSKTMESKIQLFENMDENAYTFSRIVDTAKMALKQLQTNEGYNYYSAELIWKFFQIEDLFKRRLKPMGVREVEKKVNGHTQTIPTIESKRIHEYHEQSEDEKYESVFQNERVLSPEVDGKKLNRELKKKKHVFDTLNGASFNE